MTNATSEPIRLTGWYDTINESVLALLFGQLFGQLVERALPVVKHYQSDLYHDAIWLKKYVVGPITFEYVVRDCGTHIGTDLMTYLFHDHETGRHGALCGDTSAIAYSVNLTRDGGMWSVTFTTIPQGGECR